MFNKDQLSIVRSAVSDKLTDSRILLSEYNIRRERLDDFDTSDVFSKEYYEKERNRYSALIEKLEEEIVQLRDVLISMNNT